MEYIRYYKFSPEYNPNTRHCIHGLDADLIMLSLICHEPHMILLREIVINPPRSDIPYEGVARPELIKN